MKDKDRWISRTIQLEDDFSSYEGMVTALASAELSSTGSRYHEVKNLVEETKTEVTDAMQTVEAEDRARRLYTLQTAPTLLLEYPKISGRDTQCFFSFKEKVLRCLKSNKVLRVDQPSKLRELLTGHPLALVPESIKTLEKALSVLGDRYGDEERVLGLRVAELEKLGTVQGPGHLLNRP